MTNMETFGVVCRERSHPTKVATVGVFARRPGSRVIEMWPIKPYSTKLVRQQIDADDRPYAWMAGAPDGTVSPDARAATETDRTRIVLDCPLCGLNLTKRWPDQGFAEIVNAALDAGVSSISLAALAAILT